MRLSIVIPTLNEAGNLPQLLESLAPLRAAGVEIVVADADSTDGTVVVAEHAGVRCLLAPRGRARQMNAGAKAANGELLLFLHADTRLPERADELIAEALADGRHQWGRFDVSISGQPLMLRVVAAMMNLRSRLSGIATGDQALFITRSAFDAVGGFPDQALMEDVEISRRLRAMHAPACLRARVITSGRRWETRGVWRTIFLMWRLRWDYWRGVPAAQLAERYR